jgi:hypothetical protein
VLRQPLRERERERETLGTDREILMSKVRTRGGFYIVVPDTEYWIV